MSDKRLTQHGKDNEVANQLAAMQVELTALEQLVEDIGIADIVSSIQERMNVLNELVRFK